MLPKFDHRCWKNLLKILPGVLLKRQLQWPGEWFIVISRPDSNSINLFAPISPDESENSLNEKKTATSRHAAQRIFMNQANNA